MEADAAPEIEVQVEEDMAGEEGGDSGPQKTPNSKKGKRNFKKPENILAFYEPAPYTSPSKGGRGKGDGKRGKGDGEEGRKGKGKGAYYQDGEAPAKPIDDAAQSSPSVPPGPVAMDGDSSQPKGGANAKKKAGGKNREGGKGGKGNGGGGSGGGGKAQQPNRKGGPGKGPRGPAPPSDMLDAGPEAEGPRPPGPQQRPPPVAKGVAVPNGMVGMPVSPVGGVPYGAVPYPYAGMPAMPFGQAGGMYALPFYLMPGTPGLQGVPQSAQSYAMPGAAPMAAPPPPVLSPAQRSELVGQVYKQMEYYFSMENLLKDVHLRKHMTDEGWVPISLVAGFKKMQNMTMDMNIVMEAITSTQFFETNAPNNTHLRIRNDWQRWILAPQQPGQAAPALAAAPPPQPAIRSNP